MRAQLLGPSVELPIRPRNCHASAATGALGGAPYGATERVRGVATWARRCHASAATLWGQETCEGCGDMGAVVPCERSHWGPRWSSLWGHETCE
eukprot:1000251-Pyramimonas_sp.AAC.1